MKTLNELNKEIQRLKGQLNEAYMFDQDEPQMPPQEETPMQGEPQMQGGEGEGESEEEKAMRAQEIAEHEPIIMKMREIALQGLQKYADQPLSSLYTFFKKVWMESDKVITDEGGGAK